MTARRQEDGTAPVPRPGRIVTWAVAAALAVSAYVHWDIASPPYFAAGQVTLSGMFLAQAAAAAVVAVWVALTSVRLAVLAAAAVGAGSLLALVLSVYVRLPSFGPFPALYEPLWYPEKVVAAVAAGVAAALAALALARASTVRSR